MTDLRKAAEMALEFVSWLCGDDHSVRPKNKALDVREALRQALAQPKREWVGLTDEDLSVCDEDGVLLARYWETKLKEKNT